MRALLLAAALAPSLALADGAVPVTLPTIPTMTQSEMVTMLDRLVVANVVSSNCPGFDLDMADWGLLTGTADLIAEKLGLDATAYDAAFYGPAFDLLDQPDTCTERGPDVVVMLDMIAKWGGRRTVD